MITGTRSTETKFRLYELHAPLLMSTKLYCFNRFKSRPPTTTISNSVAWRNVGYVTLLWKHANCFNCKIPQGCLILVQLRTSEHFLCYNFLHYFRQKFWRTHWARSPLMGAAQEEINSNIISPTDATGRRDFSWRVFSRQTQETTNQNPHEHRCFIAQCIGRRKAVLRVNTSQGQRAS